MRPSRKKKLRTKIKEEGGTEEDSGSKKKKKQTNGEDKERDQR